MKIEMIGGPFDGRTVEMPDEAEPGWTHQEMHDDGWHVYSLHLGDNGLVLNYLYGTANEELLP